MPSLVPITSVSRPGQLATPATSLARLIPDQIVELPNGTAYWFKKGGTGSGRYQGRRERASGTDFAMIVVPRSGGTFKVQYYPKDGTAQIVAELPFDKLPLIIDDLAAAGFPVAVAPTLPSSTQLRPGFPKAENTVQSRAGGPFLEA